MDEKDIEKKMQEAWNDQINEDSLADKEAHWQEFAAEAFPPKEKHFKKRFKKWLYPVAAVLAVALTIGAFINYGSTAAESNSLAYTIIENPSEIVKMVILPDSSLVELEPNAEIRYKEDFTSDRQIKLNGKAFFNVHKDKKHPFKVRCHETTTTVLGTCFTIDGASENTIQVDLYEGRVQMNVKDNNSNWILSPGEQFIYKNNKVSVVAFNRFQDFNDATLGEVLKYIKKAYGYRVEIPKEFLNKKITLRLNKREDLKDVVEIIAQMYELTPTINEKLNKISLQ